MEKVLIYNTISLCIPEGFHVMEREEIQERFRYNDPESWAMWKPDSHIIIAIHRKKLNPILGLIADKKTVRAKLELECKNAKAKNGYRQLEEYEKSIQGKQYLGFYYGYEASNIPHIGENLIIIRKNWYYVISCYYREENREQAHGIFDEALNSLSFL